MRRQAQLGILDLTATSETICEAGSQCTISENSRGGRAIGAKWRHSGHRTALLGALSLLWFSFGSGRALVMLVSRWNHSKAQQWPFLLLSGLTFKRQKFNLTFQAKNAIKQQGKKNGLAQSLKAFALVPESCICDKGQVIFCFKIHGF